MASYTDITGIGRELNPRIPSNRWAVVGAAGAFLVLLAVSWGRDELSILGALFGAVAVFLGWAVERELDPDRSDAAMFALAGALVAAIVGSPSALAAGVALITVRLVAGTVGVALKSLDLVALAATAAVAAGTPILWIAGAALGIWAWTAPEAEPNRRSVRVAFVVGVVGGLAYAAWRTWYGDGFVTEVTLEAYVWAAVAGAAMMLASRHLPVASSTDEGSSTIAPERVRLARITAGSIVMWAAVFGGVTGFWALGPVFAALVVAAVYRVFVHPA